jgi:hypothetical protein
MQLKTAVQITIGATGYIAWAIMAFLDPTLRPDFLRFNIGMAVGTIGLVLRDMGTSSPAAPTDKKAGNALPAMLGVLALGSALALAGCATGQPQSTQATYTQACATYGAAFATALELRQAGKLNKAQIDQVTLIDSQITPVCTGPLPTDATAATQKVTAAVTSMLILEAIHKEQ